MVVAGQGTPRVENPAWEEGLSLLGIRSLSIYGRHACLAGVGELPALSPLPIGQTASLPFRVFLAAVRGPASEFWLGALAGGTQATVIPPSGPLKPSCRSLCLGQPHLAAPLQSQQGAPRLSHGEKERQAPQRTCAGLLQQPRTQWPNPEITQCPQTRETVVHSFIQRNTTRH